MIKIALTGSHGVGKTTITHLVSQQAKKNGYVVEVVSSPTRYLKNLGKPYGIANNKDSDGQLELMNLTTMRLRGWEAEQRLAAYGDARLNEPKPTLIIGDRCTLDMVAYLQVLINQADWSASDEKTAIARNRLIDTAHLALPFALNDVGQFWDVLCYKPPHPDHLSADPDRLDDRNYQLAVDRCIVNNWERAQYLPGLSTRALDVDLYKAADEVWKLIKEIEKS